jgi:cytochrome c peroxidase
MFLNDPQTRKSPLFSLLLVSGLLFVFSILFSSFKTNPGPNRQIPAIVKERFMQDLATLLQKTALLEADLQLLEKKQTTIGRVQEGFMAVKFAYKRTEYLTEYLDPELARKLNGAPLPKVVVSDADYLALGLKEPLFITLPPEGLQVLEEVLFEEDPDAAKAYLLAHKLEEGFTQLSANLQHQPLTEKQLLESMREELLRVITMGITGFDAPAAGQEMKVAATALEPVLENVQLYEKNSTGKVNGLSKNASQNLQKTIAYLQENTDFDGFDRLHFIREFADPTYGLVTGLQKNILQETGSGNAITKPVNDLATSLFAPDFLKTAYYAKQDRDEPNPKQIALGKMLFFDPVLSSNNQRSCASCHNPAKAFTDGQTRSMAFDPAETVGRNSPTLLNAIFSTAYFWDSRASFLEDQISEVVNKPQELHSNYVEVVQKLNQSETYQKLFRQAYKTQANNTLNTSTINRAIAAYIRSLVSLDSPFDKYMRRETAVLSAAAIRGGNLFMGKAACATCHFAPVFNGTVPPRFMESETEVIGVPFSADFANPLPDPDLGRAKVVQAEVYKQAFKTPTVRNAQLTAPYMHNGAFNTLTEVVEFYNRGGGAGLGLAVPNQTLPFDHLTLTEQEKKDIVAFMESLTDQPATLTAPVRLPRFPENTSLYNRPVGGTY